MSGTPTQPQAATFRPGRAAVVLGAVAAALVGLVARTAHLQTTGADHAAEVADRQQHGRTALPARRGSIFDRHGLLLAGTTPSRHVFLDGLFFHQQTRGRDPAEVAEALDTLADVLRREPVELARAVGAARQKRYVVLDEHVSDAVAREIERLDLPGVGLTRTDRRLYPAGTLAAHVLGGTGRTGHGLEGTELVHDGFLRGTDGQVRVTTDARRRPLVLAAGDAQPPEHGGHLVLTLDANVQRIAEEELAATCREHNAKSGEAVVMDPRTGDVLALAAWPRYDPATPGDAPDDRRRNRALTDPYEPGSVLKPFVVAAALDAGDTTVGEVWPLHGPVWRTPYGRRITDVRGYDELTSWDVLVKSSNIGMAMLAQRMGNPSLRSGLDGFGFGRPTGVDLPGEGSGVLNPLARWSHYSTDSVAQGYELLVTPMQLCRAMAALANDGRLMRPRVVAGTLSADGTLTPAETLSETQRAASPEAARAVLRVLADIPVRGTARRARLDDYALFGKTGPAHQAVDGKYNESDYAASFIGGAPYEDPRLVIALVVRHPDRSVSHYGGIVAAPAAGRILDRALRRMNVPPSPPLPPYPADVDGKLHGQIVADAE